jgi:beta-N-acetylhexosaminidase
MPEPAFDEVASRAKNCSAVVLAAFSQQLSAAPTRFVGQLQQGPAPVALISFGNPYLMRAFPKVHAYVATFSTAPTSEAAVAKAMLGAIPFRGRSPVTIPNLAAYGAGLD